MNFTISKESILQGLAKVQAIVNAKTTLPVLSNVMIKASEGQVEFSTTDLELSVRTSVEAQVDEEGSTTLPVRKFFSICRELPGGDIKVSVDDANIATIKCQASRFKIIGISDEDFPPVPDCSEGNAYSLDQAVLREMLQKTGYAASTDETRYILNGVLMSFRDEKLTVVATDGRRLALVEQEIEFPAESERDFILPTKAVHELLKTLGDEGVVSVQATDNQVAFDFGAIRVVSKLIDGNYPNFKQVIPAGSEVRITVEREELLNAVRRAALVTSEQSNSLNLVFANNRVEISGESIEVGEAHESMAVKYDGNEIRAAFNPEFLMDPLRNIESDEVYLELTDELSPGVIKTDVPFLYVLMPMRVS